MPWRPEAPLGSSRSSVAGAKRRGGASSWSSVMSRFVSVFLPHLQLERLNRERTASSGAPLPVDRPLALIGNEDRKSTRLNSSHLGISYAVFWLENKNK